MPMAFFESDAACHADSSRRSTGLEAMATVRLPEASDSFRSLRLGGELAVSTYSQTVRFRLQAASCRWALIWAWEAPPHPATRATTATRVPPGAIHARFIPPAYPRQ